MRIESIRINEQTNVITIGDKQLRGVIITTKSWLGKTKEIKAFPTSYGLPGKSGRMLFYYFCDEKGKELSMDISQQINNYLLNQRLMIEENSIKPADGSLWH